MWSLLSYYSIGDSYLPEKSPKFNGSQPQLYPIWCFGGSEFHAGRGKAALLFGVASVEISRCHLACDGFCTAGSLQGWPGDKEQPVLFIWAFISAPFSVVKSCLTHMVDPGSECDQASQWRRRCMILSSLQGSTSWHCYKLTLMKEKGTQNSTSQC